MKNKLSLLALLIFLSGCGMMDAYRATSPTLAGGMQNYDAIDKYASETEQFYKARKGKARVVGTSGAIGLASLATAGAAAAQGGASPGSMAMISTIGNLIGQILGIVDPPERANAYAMGENAITEARADGMSCVATEQPVLSCAAALYKKVAATNKAVDALLQHILPDDQTIEALKQPFQNLVVIKAQTEVSNVKVQDVPDRRIVPVLPANP